MMGKVLHISDYVSEWERVYFDDSGDTTLEIHIDKRNGQLDLCMFNDEGECIRKELTPDEVLMMTVAVTAARKGSNVER